MTLQEQQNSDPGHVLRFYTSSPYVKPTSSPYVKPPFFAGVSGGWGVRVEIIV